jgi:hypothetical protein
MTDAVSDGSLKLVTARVPDHGPDTKLERTLIEHIDAENVRRLHKGVFLIHTDAEPSAVRDWLVPQLSDGECVFVAEFERWSSHGPAIDRRWLLRRGH